MLFCNRSVICNLHACTHPCTHSHTQYSSKNSEIRPSIHFQTIMHPHPPTQLFLHRRPTPIYPSALPHMYPPLYPHTHPLTLLSRIRLPLPRSLLILSSPAKSYPSLRATSLERF